MSNLKRIKTYMGTVQKSVPQGEEDGAQIQKQQVSFQEKINNIIIMPRLQLVDIRIYVYYHLYIFQ